MSPQDQSGPRKGRGGLEGQVEADGALTTSSLWLGSSSWIKGR